jgi:hypothetical protein
MATTTDRLPSGFTEHLEAGEAPTVEEVRRRVALAVTGLEQMHAEVARRRREADDLDRQVEEMEAALTGRPAVADPAGPVNGMHRESDPGPNIIGRRELSHDDAVAIVERLNTAGQAPAIEINGTGADTEVRDDGREPEETGAGETGTDGPVPATVDSIKPGPGMVMLAIQADTKEAPLAKELMELWCVNDWRSIPIEHLVHGSPEEKRLALLHEFELWGAETIDDVANALSEDDSIEDLLVLDGDPSLLRARLRNFRQVRGWDDSTRYPDGIPAEWIEPPLQEIGTGPTEEELLRAHEVPERVEVPEFGPDWPLTAEEANDRPKVETSPFGKATRAALVDFARRVAAGDTAPQWGRWSELVFSVRLQSSTSVVFRVLHDYTGMANEPLHLSFHWGLMDKRYRSLHLDGAEIKAGKIAGLDLGQFCFAAARHLLIMGGAPCDEQIAQPWRKLDVAVLGLNQADTKAFHRAGLRTEGDLWDCYELFNWQTIPHERMPSHACLDRAAKALEAAIPFDAPEQPGPARSPAKPDAKPAGPAKPAEKETERTMGVILTEDQIRKLRGALQPNNTAWVKLQQHGATDEELARAIGRRFDAGMDAKIGGRQGDNFSVKGGQNPQVWWTRSGITSKKAADFKGPPLTAASRTILNIKLPSAAPVPLVPIPAVDSKRPPPRDPKFFARDPLSVLDLPSSAVGQWTKAGIRTIGELVREYPNRYGHRMLIARWDEAIVALEKYFPAWQTLCDQTAAPAFPRSEAEILADTSHGFAAPARAKATDDIDRELLDALDLDHRIFGPQWKALQDDGATDAVILKQLGSQWPFSFVFTRKSPDRPGHTVTGGKAPGIWVGVRSEAGMVPTLHSSALAARVRRLLAIAMPAKPEPKRPARGKPKPARPAAPQQPKKAAAKKADLAEFIPEPIGGWSIVKMGEAAGELLGKHRESQREAALVVCLACKAMRARQTGNCPACDDAALKSYARLKAEILDRGAKKVAGEMKPR